ncbi:MAG TPA: 50S ribosomal protein L23 [Candidatus Saccharimonadales bacterium]|nr:50S ribosomal protein L23 [Candidatus Saccharimonadales bacterium]
MDKQVYLKPRMSEKAYAMSQNGVYVLDIPASLNRHTVASAVAAQFDVTVIKVNITNIKGKAKRTVSQKGRRINRGSDSSVKKAYITLKEGDSLPFFEAVEQAEEKQQATQEKVSKAMEKQAEKAEKKSKPGRRGLHLPHKKTEDK